MRLLGSAYVPILTPVDVEAEVLRGDGVIFAGVAHCFNRGIEPCRELGIFLTHASACALAQDFRIVRNPGLQLAAGRTLFGPEEGVERERVGLDIVKPPSSKD